MPAPDPAVSLSPEWQSYIQELCHGDEVQQKDCEDLLRSKTGLGLSTIANLSLVASSKDSTSLNSTTKDATPTLSTMSLHDQIAIGRLISAIGLVVLLGSSLLQAVSTNHNANLYLLLTLVESVVALVVGVKMTRLVLTVAGSIGIVVAGLLALAHNAGSLALYLTSALLAVLLLGLATYQISQKGSTSPTQKIKKSLEFWK